MIMRIWTTQIDETRAADYDAFARGTSLPMFRAQPGFRGVLFGREGRNCTVVTLWDSPAAADALEDSTAYRETVALINATGFLQGASTVERRDLLAIELRTL